MARERTSLHAAADAAQYGHMLQQGVDSYMHLSRDLAGFIAASGQLSQESFSRYIRATRVLETHPGVRYIGYISRAARTEPVEFEPAPNRAGAAALTPSVGPDPDSIYPHLYAYPRDQFSKSANGLDFSTLPERWVAMQQARDSGESTATSRHDYVTRPAAAAHPAPIIAAFTPVYDLNAPVSTIGERRAALRGFVFALIAVDEMVDRVMGSSFKPLFDLEIYDGAVRPANLLYDGDGRPMALAENKVALEARQEVVSVGNRTWRLLFGPRTSYTSRYASGQEFTVLALGLCVSAALAYATLGWTRRLRLRSLRQAQGVRFDAVFEHHPSAVYLLDREGRFLNANAQAVKELKTARTALIGARAGHFLAPECRRRARDFLALALDENSVSFDSAVIDGEGSRIDMSVVLIPVVQNGTTTSVLCIAENVTERKVREWRLEESKKMLWLVINNVPQRIFWKDTELRYLGCNQAFCKDAGLAHPDDIVGKTDFDMPWLASAQAYRRDDRETLERNAPKVDYEERQQRKDGSERWLRTSKIPLTDFEGRTVALLCMYEDITARKTMERQLKDLAHYDSLTGLVNRGFFLHQLDHAVSRARRHGSEFALMYLDLDRFKSINDTMGHDAGDSLLQGFAQRILEHVRETDIVARLGGDEFAILLEDLPGRAAAECVAGKLVKAMEAPLPVKDGARVIGTSIGIAFSGSEPSVDDLVRRADQAMYQAKRGGRNRFEVDDTPNHTQIARLCEQDHAKFTTGH
jgi:diguanylate cyclase (GGDEF)-like protein/PAS domain S-box-containing protein